MTPQVLFGCAKTTRFPVSSFCLQLSDAFETLKRKVPIVIMVLSSSYHGGTRLLGHCEAEEYKQAYPAAIASY
jgi:hypothetical protein